VGGFDKSINWKIKNYQAISELFVTNKIVDEEAILYYISKVILGV